MKGILTGLIASAPLGPTGVLCIQRTINRGIIAGLAAGAGATVADTFYAIVASFGITYILDFLHTHRQIIVISGSLFLLVIGARIFRTNPAIQIRKQKNKNSTYFGDFITVLFITITNPLAVVFFGGALAWWNMVVPDHISYIAIIFTLGIFLGSLIWWFGLCGIVNWRRRYIRLRNLFWINKITGALIFVLGILAVIKAIFF